MLRNYLTVAFWNLLWHQTFSCIRILWFAFNLAGCLLIQQYKHFELRYNGFHWNESPIFYVPNTPDL